MSLRKSYVTFPKKQPFPCLSRLIKYGTHFLPSINEAIIDKITVMHAESREITILGGYEKRLDHKRK